jgi:SAM-dependent methyltransferase
MSHPAQLEFFGLVFKLLQTSGTTKPQVIDFGSLDINGGPHQLVQSMGCDYVGVDLAEGKNVTLVEHAELVGYSSSSFDVVMSSELFEHTPVWREVLYNMCRLVKPGGMVVFSCAGRHRPEHGTSRSDEGYSAPFVVNLGMEYYKNVSARNVSRAISLNHWFSHYGLYENPISKDTYFVGRRKGGSESLDNEWDSLLRELHKRYSHSVLFSELRYFQKWIILRLASLTTANFYRRRMATLKSFRRRFEK